MDNLLGNYNKLFSGNSPYEAHLILDGLKSEKLRESRRAAQIHASTPPIRQAESHAHMKKIAHQLDALIGLTKINDVLLKSDQSVRGL